MTLFDAILSLVPNARFSIENNDYDTINWSDSRDKPTREEVEAEVTEGEEAAPATTPTEEN